MISERSYTQRLYKSLFENNCKYNSRKAYRSNTFWQIFSILWWKISSNFQISCKVNETRGKSSVSQRCFAHLRAAEDIVCPLFPDCQDLSTCQVDEFPIKMLHPLRTFTAVSRINSTRLLAVFVASEFVRVQSKTVQDFAIKRYKTTSVRLNYDSLARWNLRH